MGGFRCLGFQGVVVYVDRLRNEEQAVDSCLHRPNKCLVVLWSEILERFLCWTQWSSANEGFSIRVSTSGWPVVWLPYSLYMLYNQPSLSANQQLSVCYQICQTVEDLIPKCSWCLSMVKHVLGEAIVFQTASDWPSLPFEMNHNPRCTCAYRGLLTATGNCAWPVIMSLLVQGVQLACCCVKISGLYPQPNQPLNCLQELK